MRERLRNKIDEAAIGNVEIDATGVLTYDHTGDPADFVYSRYALHHLPDFWEVMALRRVRAILRPGGVFRLWDVVYGFNPAEADERIEAWAHPSARRSRATGLAGRWRSTCATSTPPSLGCSR
jgi:SAM-dependent methyltransferase